MKAPSFWHADGLIPRLLEPFSQIFNMVSIINRTLSSSARIGVPIVCVGNIVSGGAGKTPIAISIGKILRTNYKIGFLTRGYRGRKIGPIKVNPCKHSIEEVGDEALLLARVGPTWVSKDRRLGAFSAKRAGVDVIIMDDGFQNPSVHKDLSLVVIDGQYGFGNGRLMPSGPLREKISNALIRADAVVMIGECLDAIRHQLPDNIKVINASMTPNNTKINFPNSNVIAFAGIGRPQKFLSTLKEMNLNVLDFISYPDHYKFKEAEILNLHKKATKLNATLLTTFKDLTRVPKNVIHLCQPIGISIVWENEQTIKELLNAILEKNE